MAVSTATYGANYNSGYVASPPVAVNTSSSAVRRTMVDTITTDGDTDVAINDWIAVGEKLQPGTRIIDAQITTNGTGSATNGTVALIVHDGTTETTLTAAVDSSAGGSGTTSTGLTQALLEANGVVLAAEGTVYVDVLVAALDVTAGEIVIRVDYLAI